MQTYEAKSGMMELGTLASGSVIFSLNNLSTTKSVPVKRLLATLGFTGTPANSGIEFGVCRATGTPGGGTGNVSGSSIVKEEPGEANSFCSVYYGPAAITGLTPDTPGDFNSVFLAHQVGTPQDIEIIREDMREQFADEFLLAPSTSLVVITRTISIAGSKAAFNVRWGEPV